MRHRIVREIVVLAGLAALGWACSSAASTDEADVSGADTGDAAGDPSDDLGSGAFELIPPELPVLSPCPSGWTQVPPADEDDAATCEPWPDGVAEECTSDDEAHFVGEAGCTRIGSACSPDAEWAQDLPSERTVLYVRAGTDAGGSGTPESPYGTIGEALATAESGTVLALSKGTFDEAVELSDGVTLWGACVAETVLTASTPNESEAIINVNTLNAGIRNLQLGGPRPGILVGEGSSADLEDVLIAGATAMAWVVLDGGRATGSTVVVRDTARGPFTLEGGTWDQGTALLAVFNAEVSVTRTIIEGSFGIAIWLVNPGSEGPGGGTGPVLELTDAAIRDTVAFPPPGPSAPAVSSGIQTLGAIEAGPEPRPIRVDLSRVILDCAGTSALTVMGADTALSLTDVVIRGSLTDTACGSNVGISFAAEADISRTLFDRIVGFGLFSFGNVSLSITDSVFRDTTAPSDFAFGGGLWIGDGTVADTDRLLFRNNVGSTLFLWNPGTTLNGSNVTIVDTAELGCADTTCSDRAFGSGATVRDEATMALTQFRISGSPFCGLQLAFGGTATLEEGQVSNNTIGVNVQTEGFDLDRLTNRVIYLDNGRNLDAASLPVPDPSVAFMP